MKTRITPSTTSLLKPSIRAELPAQYIQQLPSIQNLLLHLEGKGRSENTRIAYEKNLKALAIRADLKDTKTIELEIARYKKKNGQPITNNYKSKLCDCYNGYLKFYQIYWEKPIYTPEPTTIQPPTQEKIQMLISSARLELSIKLDISAQTGLRPIEVQGEKGLKAKNIHPDQNTTTARITKGCNARPPLPISKELTARLQEYITKHNLKTDEILFTGKAKNYGQDYRVFRNRLAKKLQIFMDRLQNSGKERSYQKHDIKNPQKQTIPVFVAHRPRRAPCLTRRSKTRSTPQDNT